MKLPKAQNYPKSLNINEEIYKVRFKKKFKDKDTRGETDSAKKTIEIIKDMSPYGLLRTFVHECLHALEFEYNIQIRHKTVYELEEAICAFLIDNF